MDWQAMFSAKLANSDLWLLSLYDRFACGTEAGEWRRLVQRKPNLLAALAMIFQIMGALVAHAERIVTRPPLPRPPRLPAAGHFLTPRLLPIPAASRRG